MTRVMAAHACTGAELGETEAPLEPPICLRDEVVIEVHVVRDKDAVPYELHEAGDEGSRRAAARETGECLPPPARVRGRLHLPGQPMGRSGACPPLRLCRSRARRQGEGGCHGGGTAERPARETRTRGPVAEMGAQRWARARRERGLSAARCNGRRAECRKGRWRHSRLCAP